MGYLTKSSNLNRVGQKGWTKMRHFQGWWNLSKQPAHVTWTEQQTPQSGDAS